MMKKYFITALLILTALILLCSCARVEKNESDGLKIVTTVFPQYDFTKNITNGTDAEVVMLLKSGSEPHSYEPSPADVLTIAECDLFIWVGGESEAWAKKLIDTSGIDESRVLALMDIVPLIEVSDDHDHEDKEYDEHVWTSPKNAILITEAITKKLCEMDAKSSDAYTKNSAEYIKELDTLDIQFEKLGENADGKALIVGDRFPFIYLAREYGFNYISPFRGCSSHAEASAADIARVIEAARADKSPIVFSVDFSNEKLAKAISDEVGGEVRRLHSCHTVAASDVENGIGYIELMKENLKNIKEAIEN